MLPGKSGKPCAKGRWALLNLDLCSSRNAALKLLCLGAHSDDIEIGCGGTVLALQEKYPKLHVQWVVFSGIGPRGEEARHSAGLFLARAAEKNIDILEFRDTFFPAQWDKIKLAFAELKPFAPDLVFTHYHDDLHQDHRIISELTWNAFRDHFILEYEVPKWDGDMGRPNFYVPIEQRLCHQKIENLLSAFKSQASKHWFDQETFLSLLRLRGVESNAPERYAEAFHARKMSLDSFAKCPADETRRSGL
jgi:LmbE family N-acetylglucosaminyl deacetylase